MSLDHADIAQCCCKDGKAVTICEHVHTHTTIMVHDCDPCPCPPCPAPDPQPCDQAQFGSKAQFAAAGKVTSGSTLKDHIKTLLLRSEAPAHVLHTLDACCPTGQSITFNPSALLQLIADIAVKNWPAVLDDIFALFGTPSPVPTP